MLLIALLLGVTVTAISQTKLCINCKFFTKDWFFTSNEYGLCQKYPKKSDITAEYLVTGELKPPVNDFYYCSTARGSSDMCGPVGKDFKKKYKRRLGIQEENKES